jgi:hypothetical protein
MNCIHVGKDPDQQVADVTIQSTGETHTLCMDCFKVFQSDPRKSPVQSVCYNIDYSLDPDLPKEQWTKANDEPIPPTESGKIHYVIPAATFNLGAIYYIYCTGISAIGLESYPSEVIKCDKSENIDLPVF